MPKDLMTDIQAPDLTERLAKYVGALNLREQGSVDDDFVEKRLEDLQVACRAADRLLKVEVFRESLREVSDAMHRGLTSGT